MNQEPLQEPRPVDIRDMRQKLNIIAASLIEFLQKLLELIGRLDDLLRH